MNEFSAEEGCALTGVDTEGRAENACRSENGGGAAAVRLMFWRLAPART